MLRSLCENFNNTESSLNCSYVYFQNNCPFDVINPNPNDWGTCCYQTCLDPELKLDALSKAVEDSSLKWDEAKNYHEIDNLITKIKTLKYDKKIGYNEWRMVLNPKSKKGNKVSRKLPVSKKFCAFISILSREL